MTTQIQKPVVINQVVADMLVGIQPDSVSSDDKNGTGGHYQLFLAILFSQAMEHLDSLRKVHCLNLDASPCSKLVEAMTNLTALMHPTGKQPSIEKVQDLIQRGYVPANMAAEPYEEPPVYVSADLLDELCHLLRSTLYYWLENKNDLKQSVGNDLVLQLCAAGEEACRESYEGRVHCLEFYRRLEEERQKKAGGASLDFDL